VPTWILVLSLSLAGAVLLIAGLVALAVVVRRGKKEQRMHGLMAVSLQLLELTNVHKPYFSFPFLLFFYFL
jgi:hypothetical protein